MNISIFNRKYYVRRFSTQRIVKGYLVSDYKDEVVSIHVHASSPQTVNTGDEGQRNLQRLQGHGSVKLTAADQELNQKGDLLLYEGHWYECRGCTGYDHTPLGHYNYDFVQIPVDAAESTDLADMPTIPAGQGEGCCYHDKY